MSEIINNNKLFADLVEIIESGKKQLAQKVNSILTLTYWHVGKRINKDVLQNQRAEYGKQIVATLSTQLSERFGKSFEARNLRRMMQFAELFPDIQIVSPLATQLSWSHFMEILPIQKEEARIFYAEQVRLLNMQKDGIMVAGYWTELPPKKLLEQKLHDALIEAKERLERKKLM
jgi:hypothetical protein